MTSISPAALGARATCSVSVRHLSFFLLVFFYALFFCCSVVLSVSPLWRALILVALAAFIHLHLHKTQDRWVDCVLLQHSHWYLRLQQQTLPVVLLPHSVITRWLMVLYWQAPSGQRYCVLLLNWPWRHRQSMRQLRCCLRLYGHQLL